MEAMLRDEKITMILELGMIFNSDSAFIYLLFPGLKA